MSIGEQERIAEWHFECFSKLDFSIGAIESLLSWGTEPHEVLRLTDAGCPEELVLRIVQPLDDPVIITPESVRA